ncbi:hypothetical protein GOZ96_04835 [Agrobacterium vitis]|uniref:Uncharacterized protein n=1 Tax=Agrobacterium vitis TaxID=373 RepID=A0A7J4X4L6_AGRVI|nr:hypothetical protein [Agrobacterium vitis]KAA3527066.1 hypothetical protein DXT89_14120 [Agrobacterium vitis]MUZ95915.1 hypothetical protein [Agrobacterium vitis]
MTDAEAQLHAVVNAWEALPGGRQCGVKNVESWLARDMAPAINSIRGFLQRPRPDGVLPPCPPDQSARIAELAEARNKALEEAVTIVRQHERNSEENMNLLRANKDYGRAKKAECEADALRAVAAAIRAMKRNT